MLKNFLLLLVSAMFIFLLIRAAFEGLYLEILIAIASVFVGICIIWKVTEIPKTSDHQ